MQRRRNFRVVVKVDESQDRVGDYWYERNMLNRANAVCKQINRHVDGVHSGGNIEYDFYCEHCNLSWEEDADGVPVCCNKAVAEFAENKKANFKNVGGA